MSESVDESPKTQENEDPSIEANEAEPSTDSSSGNDLERQTSPDGEDHSAVNADGLKTDDLDDLDSLDLDDDLESDLEGEHLPPPKLKALLTSPDLPSRFMTLLSGVFGLLALACMGLLVVRYIQMRNAKHTNDEHVAAGAPVVITESIGQFKLFLKSKNIDVPERELRVNITVECSSAQTCETLKVRLAETRDAVHPVLSEFKQEEWLSPSGKVEIRKKIVNRLNSLELPGFVNQAHFADMTIETGQ